MGWFKFRLRLGEDEVGNDVISQEMGFWQAVFTSAVLDAMEAKAKRTGQRVVVRRLPAER